MIKVNKFSNIISPISEVKQIKDAINFTPLQQT